MHPPPPDCDIHWINTGDSKISAKRTFLTPHWSNHSAMVKYNIEMLQAMAGVKPTVPIERIHEQSTFSTLWHLQCQLVEGLCRVGNFRSPLDGHTGYIVSKESFSIFLIKGCKDPDQVWEYYEIPVTAIIEKKQTNRRQQMGSQEIEDINLRKPENGTGEDF